MKKLLTTLVYAILFIATVPSIAQNTEVIDGITYDIVTISVDAPSYDASKPPILAPVKYNKLCPLVITSDDMGRGEYIRNWAFFNGYPVIKDSYRPQMDNPMTLLDAPYNSTTSANREEEVSPGLSYEPLTYSDGTGGIRRFTATSAIMPYKIGTSYTLMNSEMAKVMVRTGWSFAQHDVADGFGSKTADEINTYIKEQFGVQSAIMKGITGFDMKVLVEPNGDHRYIKAAVESNEICWAIYQNATADYPSQSKLLTYWTNKESGLPSSFVDKPTGAWERSFFQSNESTWRTNYIDVADGTSMILGGTHGLGNAALTILKDISLSGTASNKDQFWVAGADEVWEYYYLFHYTRITDVDYTDGKLTFKVKIPQYTKHQFREITLNIPGIASSGSNASFSSNVVSGGTLQNDGQYTINIGLEDYTYNHIEELTELYRSNLYNQYLKRDAQYLIDRLLPGTKKDSYQAALDAEPKYSYEIKDNFGTVIVSGASDANDEVNYKYPKYVLNEGTLYEAAKNTAKIQNTNIIANYVGAYTPSGKNQEVVISYTPTEINDVAFYSEGEDIEGVTIATQEFNKINENSGVAFALRYASGGGAGEIFSPVTATTITPGKYTLVAAIGDTHTNASATFTFKVGDKDVLTVNTEDVNGYINEYRKEGIVVKTDQPLTIEAVNSGGSFWVDYLYLIKTGEYDASTPDVVLTTETLIVDMTDESNRTVTITATATPKGSASITRTVIKNSNDEIVAESTDATPTTCSYTFAPDRVGNIVFTAESVDDALKTGLSDDLSITVMSDFTLTATTNMGDDIGSTAFKEQTEDMTYRFMYPRYVLKGTTLYETEAKSTNVKEYHYGEDVVFTLANNKAVKTITYNPVATNVVFYTEGEDIEGARTWTATTIDYNRGETYALLLGSMGKCGAVTSADVTTLPAGKYKIVAGLGTTNEAVYTFKLGGETLDIYTNKAGTTYAVNEYSSDAFTLEEAATLSVACNKGKDNSQNWIDFIYIKKMDEEGDYVLGDANRDGEVTISDAVSIVNSILGNSSDSFNASAADVNKDGDITISDAVGVVNIILNGASNH